MRTNIPWYEIVYFNLKTLTSCISLLFTHFAVVLWSDRELYPRFQGERLLQIFKINSYTYIRGCFSGQFICFWNMYKILFLPMFVLDLSSLHTVLYWDIELIHSTLLRLLDWRVLRVFTGNRGHAQANLHTGQYSFTKQAENIFLRRNKTSNNQINTKSSGAKNMLPLWLIRRHMIQKIANLNHE